MLLFNSFLKKENEKEVRKHLGGFQDNFSEQQKKAIMLSLFLIANSDEEYHQKEYQFFMKAATLLGYRIKSNFGDQVDEFAKMSRQDLFGSLSSLDESQKDWYILTVFGMIHADEVPLEIEFQYASSFFDSMGITEERCENVIKKAAALQKFFKL